MLRGGALVSELGLGGYEAEVADAGLDVVDCSSRLTPSLGGL